MNGCRYNTTNGCAKCPARQPCELPFEEAESHIDDQYGTWRTDWAALVAITMVMGSAVLSAALYLTGLIQ